MPIFWLTLALLPFILALMGCSETDRLAVQVEAAQADKVPFNAYSLNMCSHEERPGCWPTPDEL